LRSDADLACVVFGAPFEVRAGQERISPGKTFTLCGGDLNIRGTSAGMRAYLCVRGGLDGPLILGSRSSLEPLVAGALIPCRSDSLTGRFLRPLFDWNAEPRLLRFLPGAQSDWFPADRFEGESFTVTPSSDRMGLRLRGVPLEVPAREIVSEPVCPGTVQVTRDGQCIVLGVDGQTIGGYPKIAQVIAADLDKLAQLRPDDRITFRRVTLTDAEGLYRRKRDELEEWLLRLRVSETITK
jgi:antagonist of KipI